MFFSGPTSPRSIVLLLWTISSLKPQNHFPLRAVSPAPPPWGPPSGLLSILMSVQSRMVTPLNLPRREHRNVTEGGLGKRAGWSCHCCEGGRRSENRTHFLVPVWPLKCMTLNSGTVKIPVIRHGTDLSTLTSVWCATRPSDPASATPGVDYVPSSRKVDFGPGVTEQVRIQRSKARWVWSCCL